jgi:recombination protein RecT
MSQQIAVKGQAETVRAALEKMKPQFQMALPKHLTPDRLLRVTMTAVQNTPKLLECDRTSLFAAIMTCAQLGLEPDGVMGQAYLVPFAGKVQFIPGFRGLITLARNSGEISSIQAHEVCANDLFEFEYGLDERLRHIPADGERGEVTHFYAYAKFKDGGTVFEVMTKAQVERVRDESQGYKSAVKFARNGVVNSPWVSHFIEMGRKTLIRRLAKYLPLSVQRAATVEDAYESGRHASVADFGEIVIEAGPGTIEGEEAEIEDKSTTTTKLDALAGDTTERKPRKTKTVEAPSEPEREELAEGTASARAEPEQTVTEDADDELFGAEG